MAPSQQPEERGMRRGARSSIRSEAPFIILSLVVLALCLFFAATLRVDKAPDEAMRYPLAYYLYLHGTLPLGNEPEIVNDVFGFSYAFTPYLPCILAALFMRALSLFSTSPALLIFAARIPSALSGALCTYATCKAGRYIWNDSHAGLLCGALVGLLPQYVFLSSYLNEDAMSVCGVAICIWAWARAWRMGGFTPTTCLHLGVGIAVVALTYYNAYGVILASVLFFFALCASLHTAKGIMWRQALLVTAVAFGLAGWFFVRNALIHGGDFLGMRSMYTLGEKLGIPEWRPSSRANAVNLGLSFDETFISYNGNNWFDMTLASYFCYVGFMEYRLRRAVFYLYIIIYSVGLVGCASVRQRGSKLPWYLGISLVLTIVIPILLSMYYSYFVDWQPQGRYIMSAAVPIAILVAGGYYKLSAILTERAHVGTHSQNGSKHFAHISSGRPMWAVLALVAVLLAYCVTHYFPACLGPAFTMSTYLYYAL